MDKLDQYLLLWGLGVHIVLTCLALWSLLRRVRKPDTWIWAVFIVLAPVFGPLLYYVFYLSPPPLPEELIQRYSRVVYDPSWLPPPHSFMHTREDRQRLHAKRRRSRAAGKKRRK